MRVVIASVQVPFLRGGAEALARGLESAIAARGHPVELVTLPFRFFPPDEVERGMQAWEAEDLTQLNLYEPDRVICLKFPAYGLSHPSRALWLCHQHRSAYELFDAKRAGPEDERLRREVAAFDRRHLPSTAPRCTISRRVSERLRDSIGLESQPLYHPPPLAGRHYDAAREPYVFYPSRIEHAKRQELLIRAAREMRSRMAIVLAGDGGQGQALERLSRELGVSDRVRFMGRVTDDEMLALYAHAAAVCFPPLDEDYGYVTLEAMLSSKAVITCTDSGGPLEFVTHGDNGLVVEPDPAALARAIDRLASDPAAAARMGRSGLARYHALVPKWNDVVDTLLAV
jgi:glycosyltransferase involved in cell wall biosynthesis